MKKSELKEYIREVILAELAEITMVGPKTEPTDVEDIVKQERTDRSTVQAAIQKAKTTNQPVGVAESEEEPSEDEIRKVEKEPVAKGGITPNEAKKEFAEIATILNNEDTKNKNKAIAAKNPEERTKEEKLHLAKMIKLTQRKKQLKTMFSQLGNEN